MSAAPIRAVIFDIGRVLVRVDVEQAMRGLAKRIPLSQAEIWSAIEKDPRWQDWQEGRIRPHDWHLHLTKRLGGNLTFEQFRDAWNRALDPKPLQPDTLFLQLKKKVRLGLLSNTDPLHVAHLEQTYSFFQHVPAGSRTYSCAVGASKPNPIIFSHALKAVRANAAETVFIDDIEAYVEAARQLGMAGIRYHSPQQLAAELRTLEVLPGAWPDEEGRENFTSA